MRNDHIEPIIASIVACLLAASCIVEDGDVAESGASEDTSAATMEDGSEGGFDEPRGGAVCPGGCTSPPTQCHQDQGHCFVDPWSGPYCYYPPKWTGSDCDDGNWCSTGSHCVNYSCVPDYFRTCNTPPSDCYETVGSCDWGSESCVYTPKAAGSACSDGLSCTSGDACDGAGTCIGGTTTCSAGQICTSLGCKGLVKGGGGEINPCTPYGNYEHCGPDTCCVWGTNCTLCI